MKKYLVAGVFMLFAAAMQWLSLSVFNSLILSFFLYTALGCVLVPVAYLRFALRIPFGGIASFVHLVPVTRKQATFAFSLGAAMALTMVVAFLFLGDVFMRENKAVALVGQWGIRAEPSSLLYFFMLFLNGGTEEFFWRGFVQRTLEESSPRWLAVSFVALFFGGQHIFVITRLVPNAFTIFLFMVAIIGSGFVWGIIRERTKSLFTCTVCHMIVAIGYLGIFARYLFA